MEMSKMRGRYMKEEKIVEDILYVCIIRGVSRSRRGLHPSFFISNKIHSIPP